MSKRIEIFGAIASGKTSLAMELEKEGFNTVYEQFNHNPFLNEFYANNANTNVFETELVFVLLHYNWIKTQRVSEPLVCDYSLLQDYCYGVNNLTSTDMKVFDVVYNHLLSQISHADLIIYLKCNEDCILERIKHRNRDMEQNISKEYIQSTILTMEKYIVTCDNVLVIESDKYNFIDKDREYIINKIIKHIKEI